MRGTKAKAIKRLVYSMYTNKTERKAMDPKTGEIVHIGPRYSYKKAKKRYMSLPWKERKPR